MVINIPELDLSYSDTLSWNDCIDRIKEINPGIKFKEVDNE